MCAILIYADSGSEREMNPGLKELSYSRTQEAQGSSKMIKNVNPPNSCYIGSVFRYPYTISSAQWELLHKCNTDKRSSVVEVPPSTYITQ